MPSIIEELPTDCIVAILKFLKSTELNSFACCSLRCDQARNHGDLDQTRTGWVNVKTNGATYVNLNDAIICGGWNNHPRSANRTRLVLMGFDKLTHAAISQDELVENISLWETVRLNQVSTLALHTYYDTRALDSEEVCNFV
jgi:hypothetical protein